jgi:hypothetical protein
LQGGRGGRGALDQPGVVADQAFAQGFQCGWGQLGSQPVTPNFSPAFHDRVSSTAAVISGMFSRHIPYRVFMMSVYKIQFVIVNRFLKFFSKIYFNII